MGLSMASLPPWIPTQSKTSKPNKKSNRTHRAQPSKQHPPPQTNPLLPTYSKSTPTPLLASTPPRSRAEAIDRLLTDLRLAADRGVRLDNDPSLFSSLLDTLSRHPSPHHHPSLLHSLIPSSLLRRHRSLSYKLVHLYVSSGQVSRAHQLFDQFPNRFKTSSAFPWNSLISGYAEKGLFEDALALYFQMEEYGVEPDEFSFPRALKACAGVGSVSVGEAVHRQAVRAGFGDHVYVLNALVDMYAKCGDIGRARRAFGNIVDRDAVSWNSMIRGYVRHGLVLEAVDIFRDMLHANVEPNSVAISTLLATFSLPEKLSGEIHGWVLRRGIERHLSVANSLIALYAGRGQLGRARTIFESMLAKDLITWNAMISAHRSDRRVLDIFKQMEDSGLSPDRVTFVSLLSACANLGLVEDGRRLFAEMDGRYRIRPGTEHYGCMVNLLGRAGLIEEAYQLIQGKMQFDGGPTIWGALLYACYVHGNVEIGEVAAERLFELEPDNEHNFELLMMLYRKARRLEGVEKVRGLMMLRGLDPNNSE